MEKLTSERRSATRRNLKMRVRLYNARTDRYENASLENISYSGLYLMTRRKLKLNQDVEIAVPSESDDERLVIQARVVRKGNHRSWGLFSYACRILHSSRPMDPGGD